MLDLPASAGIPLLEDELLKTTLSSSNKFRDLFHSICLDKTAIEMDSPELILPKDSHLCQEYHRQRCVLRQKGHSVVET